VGAVVRFYRSASGPTLRDEPGAEDNSIRSPTTARRLSICLCSQLLSYG